MGSSIRLISLLLSLQTIFPCSVTGTTRQIPELLGLLFGRDPYICPQYARNDCRQICQPNDFQLDCQAFPERPPTCNCFCPSLNPLFNFCEFRPSSFCTISCGRGGIGYRCIGPSGAEQCACFCPLNREAFEEHQEAAARLKIAGSSNNTKSINDTVTYF